MRQMILLNVGKGMATQGHGHILVRSVEFLRLRRVLEDLVDPRHLQLLQEPLFHRPTVVQVGVLLGTSQDGLHLGHPLRLGEDVRVRDRDDIRVAVEVRALDLQVGNHLTLALIVQIPPVQAAQDLQHPALSVMQAGMDGREDRSTLLDQGLGRAHRSIAVDVGDLLFRGRHHALGCLV